MGTLDDRLGYAVKIAREAGEVTLRYFGKLNHDQRHEKSDGTPVTIADRECESLLRKRILERYPDDSILGEEFDDVHGTSGYEWVIDPIDGTISFVHGVPLFGTMLACLKNGSPELGVIHMPALNETVSAADGLGCWHQQSDGDVRRVSMSRIERAEDALINSTSLSYFETPESRSLYAHLDSICKHSRGWSDAYSWVLLATGRVDAVFEPELKLWDFAAALPIITESGGVWSSFSGDTSLDATQVLAANPALHAVLLHEIRAKLS